MSRVTISRAWEDNYVYIFQYDENRAVVVDPADDKLVLRTLQAAKLELSHILVTHHHWDHVAGIEALKHKTGCTVVGSDQGRIPKLDRLVGHGERLILGSFSVDVIATPGHTRTSVCYYSGPTTVEPEGHLWTGDTLFVGGCGRLFECSAEAMWQSLERISSLPDNTWIYGGHDYAVENYRFALSIDPKNQAIEQRLRALTSPARLNGEAGPTSLFQEKQTNIFLRSACPALQSALGMPHAEARSVFAELRARKDRF